MGRPLSAEPSPPHYTDDALLVSRLGLRLILYILGLEDLSCLYDEFGEENITSGSIQEWLRHSGGSTPELLDI